MILELEGEKEDAGLDVPLLQPPLQDFTSATIATWPTPTTTKEGEEEVTILTEELERYLLSSSAGLASSPISSHLEAMHEHFSSTFPTNPAVSAHL